MQIRLPAKVTPALFLLAPLSAILFARMATHSDVAMRYPRIAALLFLWIAADALTLAVIAKAPANKPGMRAVLGAIASGCIIAMLTASEPVRNALLDMAPLVIAMVMTIVAYLGWSIVQALRAYRRTQSIETMANEILPPHMVRFVAFEGTMMRLALFNWKTAPDIPAGARAFTYHHVLNPMVGVLLVLQLIEIVVVDFLVSYWNEHIALMLLVLGIWGILLFIASMKAFRIFPILLEQQAIRVRLGTFIDICVPLDAIQAVEMNISDKDTKRKDVLNAAILLQPNVILSLSQPIEYRNVFGKDRMVERIAFRLDQPTPFLQLLEARLRA